MPPTVDPKTESLVTQKGSPGRKLNWKQRLSCVKWWAEHEDFRKTQTRNGHEMVMLRRAASSTVKSWGLFVFKSYPDYSGWRKWDENRSENTVRINLYEDHILEPRNAELNVKKIFASSGNDIRKKENRFTCFCVENTHTFIILGIAPKSELK